MTKILKQKWTKMLRTMNGRYGWQIWLAECSQKSLSENAPVNGTKPKEYSYTLYKQV